MIKEFISYETAVLARKKGFNERCVGIFYNDDPKVHFMRYIGGSGTEFESLPWRRQEGLSADYILAPLRSSLNQWLTDKYNITVYVIEDVVYGHKSDYGDSHYYIKNRHEILRPENDFMSDADAMDAGLREALNLI